MATVTLEIPDDVLAALPFAPETLGCEIRLAAALAWCSRGELSAGWAARLAGLAYAGFLEEAARRQVELFPVDIQELKEELSRPLGGGANIEKIKEELARAHARGA